MKRLLVTSFLILLPALLHGVEVDPPRDGTYLIRLLFVRHGMSCANVPWNACTTNATQISEEGMGPSAYADFTERLDQLMRNPNPVSMEGMRTDWGIRPRGWPIPGHSKTSDGLSDDCIVKANLASLVDDDYDDFGNLIAIRQLVKDPHLVSCAMAHARAAHVALAPWLASHNISFDLLASSSLKRAMETALAVFSVGSEQHVAVLPYANEKNAGTPYQPENFPYPPDVQATQMKETYGFDDWPELSLIAGDGLRYPGLDSQIDKFKAVLAMEVMPWLARQRAGAGATSFDPNPEIITALEEGRAAGHAAIPVHSHPDTPPLQSVDAGAYRYERGPTLAREDYYSAKARGAQEYVVGVGSHFWFLRTFCGYGDDEPGPRNLAVLERLMEVRVSSHTSPDGTKKTIFTVREDGPQCNLIMQPPEIRMGDLSASDLGEACTTPFDLTTVMDLQSEPTHGTTPCMAAAQASGFTIRGDSSDITSAASVPALPSVHDTSPMAMAFFFASCMTLAVGAIAVRARGSPHLASSPRWQPLLPADLSWIQHLTE